MSRNIRTFDDLNDDNGSDGEDSGLDDIAAGRARRNPRESYVGSGLAVQGPPGAGRNNAEADVFDRFFQNARQQGLTPEQLAAMPQEDDVVKVHLHVWTNGCSIEDGPLKLKDDPETVKFLDEMRQGRIPIELARLHPGKKIDIAVVDERKAFVPPKMKPFEGSGARLGNVVPNLVSNEGTSSMPVVPAATGDEAARHLDAAKKELNTDANRPTTSVQIRLPDNQRLVVTCNHDHTVGAIRNFVCTARPDMEYAPFQLMSTYPTKVLEDESVTLADAKLLNSVIAVKN